VQTGHIYEINIENGKRNIGRLDIIILRYDTTLEVIFSFKDQDRKI
jgi:hypothetical protein